MHKFLMYSYLVVLSLWAGGICIFTFVVTPVIFKSYARDMAGQIVGTLFPGYFAYLLVLSVLALILLLFLKSGFDNKIESISLFLIVAAIVINLFVSFKLHPDIKNLKQEIASFESVPQESPLRNKFSRLHAVSASLNLLVFADALALIYLSTLLKK